MVEQASYVMKINPAVEVYLLDRQGRVLAHALEGLNGFNPVGRQVDMRPVQQLLEASRSGLVRLPISGVDPLNDERTTTFSAAPITALSGWARGDGGLSEHLCSMVARRSRLRRT
ncbi:MAG: hypothetical protein U5O16_42310 [Rhodococcus sp. (in: high G+C Gram-positive bacteria)]|uniref:hypothetical protein n=1 Tax=Rhodococcus sp. TaxID=1831 RepID=UPI002AD9DCC8|nr:hypothetical protein [Rhodococcus sp. (in: high G+C Gram-positive bacteria)]